MNAPMGCELLVCWRRRWELRGAANDEDVDARAWALRAPVGRLEVKCALQGVRTGAEAATTRPVEFIAAWGTAHASVTRPGDAMVAGKFIGDLLRVQTVLDPRIAT